MDGQMKLGYFGDGPWAHEAFKKIAEDKSLKICFVTVRYDKADPDLIELAEKQQIPIEVCENINSEDFMRRIALYQVDLFVSMSFNQIFRTKMINYPRLKTINCHAGKLPFYRGRNILNWVLINDEKDFGITVHYVDEGIDTGDIILQRTYAITDQDDYGSLLNRAYKGCAETLYEAIKMIHEGRAVGLPQNSIDEIGTYFGMRSDGDEILDWNQTSREIFNFVRAISKPGPQARSFIGSKEIKINKVQLVQGSHKYKNTIGQVVGKKGGMFWVKTADTIVEVIDYTYDGVIRIGDRLRMIPK